MALGRRAWLLWASGRIEVRVAGLWSADYHGRRFTELEIRDRGSLSGYLRSGVVRTDREGNITGVEAEIGRPLALEDIRWVSGVLFFSTQEGGEARDHYELRVRGGREAELTVRGLPVRPFPLLRQLPWGLA